MAFKTIDGLFAAAMRALMHDNFSQVEHRDHLETDEVIE
jgi:hypothetical protein